MTVCFRSLTLLSAAILAMGACGRAYAGNPPRPILIRVDSVLAAESNEGIDPRLGQMRSMLQGAFSYTSYRLVNEQDQKTECGKMLSFTLPGGRILHVQPRAIDDGMIVMTIVLFEGARPMMTTDLKLMDHGNIIVGGAHYQQGILIISIGASTGSPIRPSEQPAPQQPSLAVPASAITR
ncbi:MAG TPA: hypothetical protein VMU16_14610 [Candidatus Binataceae bacterium]|nr:hypothetical protein [Candidatus Binataceae bacterium]